MKLVSPHAVALDGAEQTNLHARVRRERSGHLYRDSNGQLRHLLETGFGQLQRQMVTGPSSRPV